MKWPISFVISSLSLHRLRSIVRSCSPATGEKLHAAVTVSGLLASPETFLHNALLRFYAATGNPSPARQLFDEIPSSHKDAVDWTALIGCLARHGNPQEALRLFARMRKSGAGVDDVAAVSALGACARLRDADAGAQIHAVSEKEGFVSAVKVCNAVMDMYVKCGLLCKARLVFRDMGAKTVVSWTVILEGTVGSEGVESARAVFDAMPERNEVARTVMIAGYIAAGLTREAFALLREMIFGGGSGPRPSNHVTLCSILSAAAQSGDSAAAKWVHVHALKTTRETIGVMIETALVDAYAKCGRVDDATRVFERIGSKNTVAWNAVLGGLAMHGKGKTALEYFRRMVKEESAEPDDLTYTSLLSALSHSGLVEEGRDCFRGLDKPKLEHYSCMVDLLGRAGRLEEAAAMITEMPMPPNEIVLGSLLGSCSVHGELELAERALDELVRLNPASTEHHALLSNMYARRGRHERANSIRRGLRKVPGTSSIRVHGQVHLFCAGDRSHPMAAEVNAELDDMIPRLRLHSEC